MSRRILLSCLFAASSGFWNKVSATDHAAEYGIVEWLSSQEGAIFNPKQQVQLDASGKIGVFALEDIEKGEVLAHIPWEFVIDSTEEGEEVATQVSDDLNCETVENVLEEFHADESEFGPFVKYLKEQLLNEQIPGAWSDGGKALFVEVLQGSEQWIPPGAPVDMLDHEFYGACSVEGGDALIEQVAAVVMKLSYSDLMVPTYNFYTHRNGAHFNTKVVVERGKYFQIQARKLIQKGEQLHHSLDLCDVCSKEAVDSGYGTPEIFRDYGFIEKMPQRWSFQPGAVQLEDDEETWLYAPEQINFELVEDDNGEIQVEWAKHLVFDDQGRNYVRMLFRKELRRLYRFQNILYDFESSDQDSLEVPPQEWKQLQDFYTSLKQALRYAIYSLVNDEENEQNNTCVEGRSANEGACPAAYIDVYGIHYDDLGDEGDYLNYIFPLCEDSQMVQFYNYEDVELVQTHYQKLTFMERKSDQDVCMNLENTLQICSNYRPHYHEFFVHFPARYLPEVKRVIFIGGGDSMLLHEVLKYPTLEKVVGLELDQQVTRKSFKYFKSQPHYDKDNVEWWYGDATKSLPLLPKEYWGSFDLVLVDLSETIMSFSVTGELDIFAALSLLLKPEGIMVKNEPYIEHFSQFFDYSIHIFYGSPKICTQVLVMGSNKVDFLHHPLYEHDVEMLLVEPIETPEDRFKYFHDYMKTDARAQGKCKDEKKDSSNVTTAHGKKAGVLEIVEAESTSVALDENTVQGILNDVIQKQGLTPVSSTTKSSSSNTMIVVLKEGYVVARMYPDLKYCAFDINLWGAFEKSVAIKAALVKAVGSSSISSYRIVVGGMHGTNTWDSDKDEIGIQVSQIRDCEIKAIAEAEADINPALSIAMGQILNLLPGKEATIVVACGYEGQEGGCLALDAFPGQKVVPLWACPKLQDESSDPLDFSSMYSCEKLVLTQLQETVDDDGTPQIDLLVVDMSVPYSMTQIFNSIWSIKDNRDGLLKRKHAILAPMDPSKDEPWRRNFLERYRKENQRDPLSRAELLLESGNKSIELGFVSTADRYFFSHLTVMEELINGKLAELGNYNVWVKTVAGGIKYFDPEFDSKTFGPESYDKQPALEQASSQEPLGRQSVFQFEFVQEEGGSSSPTLDALGQFLEQTQRKLEYTPTSVEKITGVGDGGVVVTIWEQGSTVLVWDGQSHVDINTFSTDETEAKANQFVDTFAELSSLQKTLRDDQPRGTRRVVQFRKEIS